VILELSEPLQQVDLAPQAVLIDGSKVVTLGVALSPRLGGLERILQPAGSTSNTGPSRSKPTEGSHHLGVDLGVDFGVHLKVGCVRPSEITDAPTRADLHTADSSTAI
jgi:hypothetical protein